eukprot:TRINITY_DN4926_c0_g2_i11.p1 TRINITY_DN4926_c0_g2~~TRINITY_DN4926_c0_g2_i11.p1  ORF type:complete len:208 (+),score=2.80 TRINITY_DN4926_c0_g2_i11:126-749(+)
MRTPNDLVYGETNRYPIYINAAVRCIRYWLRIAQMDGFRLPYIAYRTLCELDSRGKKNWVSNVRLCLFENGFGHVWLNQGVGCDASFVSAFRQRLIDCRWQNWNQHICNSERFDIYRTFCVSHDVKPYLSMNLDRHMKYVTTKFRLGISDLTVHRYRYQNVNDDNLICPMCKKSKEDEVHFVLCCESLNDIREHFIHPKYYRNPLPV